MQRSILIVFMSIALLLFSEKVMATYNGEAVICNSCSVLEDYYSAAMNATNFGFVTVFNASTEQVKTFHVSNEPEFGGYIIEPMPNHPDANLVMTEYVELKNSFEYYNSRSTLFSNSIVAKADIEKYLKAVDGNKVKLGLDLNLNSIAGTPNGCGAEGHWSNTKYAQMPFQSACNAHDTCYSGTR